MKKIVLILGIVLVAFACSNDEKSAADTDKGFDRTALLTNWADKIIVPSYTNYNLKTAALKTAIIDFSNNPSVASLSNARSTWQNAYVAYQSVTPFYVGKAMEINLKEATNTYPTDIVGIEANVASGSYNLELFSQFSKQGFPALDYLLNGLSATDQAIIGFYTTNSNASKYKLYLVDVSNKLAANAALVLNDWTNSYRNSFVANNGNAISSSVNKTTNLFVKNLEKDIRSAKIGIPAGIFSNGTKFSNKVEAFYKKDISKLLLNAALQSQIDFFNGKSFDNASTGASLKSYLDHVKAVRGGVNLSTTINNQFGTIMTVTNGLNADFSQEVSINNAKMIAAYDALQQNVIYTKLDMMQALNITIDYVDGDGD